jgi:hypothetical protein
MADGALFAKVREETASLLGLDLQNLSLAQKTRLNLAVTLRIFTDDLQAKLIEGNAAPGDLQRLQSASETLLGLLPSDKKRHDLSPPSPEHDARRALAKLFFAMKAADEAEGEAAEVPEPIAADTEPEPDPPPPEPDSESESKQSEGAPSDGGDEPPAQTPAPPPALNSPPVACSGDEAKRRGACQRRGPASLCARLAQTESTNRTMVQLHQRRLAIVRKDQTNV